MFDFLNCDTANFKRISGFDSYGDPVATKTEAIKCKIEKKYERIKDAQSDEMVLTGTVRCVEAIGEFDKVEIDGNYVPFKIIEPMTKFGGKVAYWIGWF